MELKGKTILVTGSSSGIGRTISAACAKEGARVLIHYRKNEKGAEGTLKEVEKSSTGKIYQADLSIPRQATRMFGKIKKDFTKLDVLVNNAGEFRLGAYDDLEIWEFELHNLFFSAVYSSNEFIKFGGSKELRKIVNISSIYGFPEMGKVTAPHYSAAKAALNSFTCNLAKKLAPEVLVNAVAPGYTWTPAWEDTPEEELKIFRDLLITDRFVDPEEVATLVLEILRNDAITGEIIRIDGGIHLQKLP